MFEIFHFTIEIIIHECAHRLHVPGMSDAGSHGGASPAETDVSFTFVLDGCVAPKGNQSTNVS